MLRMISALSAIMVGVLCLDINVSAGSIMGDANGDGVVNVRDAAYIATSIVHKKTLSESADYNRDGYRNIRDAAAIAADLTSGKKGGASVKSTTYPNYAQQMLELVNNEREKYGVSPLKLDLTLCGMAEDRALEISTDFSHIRPDGTDCFSIFEQYGEEYSNAGENLCVGMESPLVAFSTWKRSPEHYSVMMDPDFTQMGVACYYDDGTEYGYHWAQIFRG